MKRTLINNIYIEFDNATGNSTEAFDLISALMDHNAYELSDETIKSDKNPEKVQDLFHNWIHGNRQIFNSEKRKHQMVKANIKNLGPNPYEVGSTLSFGVKYTYVNLLWPATSSSINPNDDLKNEVLKLKQLIEDNLVELRPKFKYRTLEENSDADIIPYLYLDGEKPGPQEKMPKITAIK